MILLIPNHSISKEIIVPNRYRIFNKTADLKTDLGNLSIKQILKYSGIAASLDLSNLSTTLKKLEKHKWTFLEVFDLNDYEGFNIIIAFLCNGLFPVSNKKLVSYFDNYLKLPNKNIGKYILALNRFTKSLLSNDDGDMVLDVAASLESIFNLSDELRLRLSLCAYYLTKKKSIMNDIYELYGLRNNYIHSNKNPALDENRKKELLTSAYTILLIPLKTGIYFNLEEINKNILNF